MADGKWFLGCGPETPIEDVREKLRGLWKNPDEFITVRDSYISHKNRNHKKICDEPAFDAIVQFILGLSSNDYSKSKYKTSAFSSYKKKIFSYDEAEGRFKDTIDKCTQLFELRDAIKKDKDNNTDNTGIDGNYLDDCINLLTTYAEPINDESDSVTSSPNTEETNMKDDIINLIQIGGCRQIIFTGAPGTGKTYIAKQIAGELSKNIPDEQKLNNNGYEFVQFHPSYDYTDFVEGIRPVDISGDIQFVKLDGIFKKFCRKVVELNKKRAQSDEQAKDDTQGKTNKKIPLYFFVIDEINRADLSKVFGELMFGLEKDKRGSDNAFATQYSNLPTYDIDNKVYLDGKEENTEDVFANGFYIPENVVIIGTMNDIDRSVESMDFALRRRFEWKEFVVDKEMLISAFKSMFGEQNVDIDNLVGSVIALNNYIEENGKNYGLNRQYDISQGQFANIPSSAYENKSDIDTVAAIKNYAWDYRIESLLREYLRGEDEGSIGSFIHGAKNAFMNGQAKTDEDNSQAQNQPDADNEPKDAESEDQD